MKKRIKKKIAKKVGGISKRNHIPSVEDLSDVLKVNHEYSVVGKVKQAITEKPLAAAGIAAATVAVIGAGVAISKTVGQGSGSGQRPS